ncbi:4-(cytidine 5'-diphospho)-2-C-methyl-D-erythritol kinase [Fusobacterium sp.]|uniref:4-(cytidine 5'-diphospho)-2-C-methyl-D-erythritol kinase n=1 Tax=Fusobacterium sp. TaxID=68766 RepID=UPI0029053A95|nr:4-(cytidine 5'-diphospho)-2-C-methyl-D-erythritol kinase [Fusobacterium sp.]MDU1910304.1 4-(cytidine 5'-diphospho)-2-C-methyl-D-erythritol kinase [Fusobacterium sp.]
MKFSLNSNGKINIGLNIIGKQEDGYHLLDMVMVPISLSDEMSGEIEDISGTLTIKTNKRDIPTGKENILYKIYDKFYDESSLEKRKIEVYLKKKIPHQAGLGGGSSNGAFLLKLLNEFHGNYFTNEKLIEIGKSIGADIPFFLINKSARVTGIGENIKIIENNLESLIIVIKPNFGVSTGKAYKNMYMLNNKKDADIDKIVLGLKENSISTIEENIENHLEQGLLLEDKNIMNFRKKLAEINNIKFFMSGSGSAYYVFADKKEAENIYKTLKEHFKSCEVHLCSSL